MLVSQWIVALCAFVTLFFLRAPLWGWLATIAVLLVSSEYITGNVGFLGGLAWLVLAGVATCIAFRPIRRQLITRHLVKPFKKVLPTISPTEQAALDAGDVWWEAKLFRGLPNWYELVNTPRSVLTSDEQAFLDNQTTKLCSMLNTWDASQAKDFPEEVWQYIKDEKFFGLVIPKEHGGHGFTALGHSAVVAKIASVNLSAAVTVMVPNSLGPGELLLHYGTDEQKKQYLSNLAEGKEIPCFGLTGPKAGSDAGAMPDTGVVCKGHFQGKEVVGIKLNFEKRYITLAPIATLIGLAVKLHDPDKLLGGKVDLGITLCLVPHDHPGIQVGERHIPGNGAFMNGPIRGKDVFIPMDWIIGGEERIGHGWRMLMECLATGRGISLPALSAAIGANAYKTTGAYAKLRQQFGVSIGEFEGIQEAMGRIGGHAYMLEALRKMTLCGIDLGFNPAVCTAISKYHMTEMARVALTDAMDVHAGKAVIDGPRNYLTEHYQGIPVAITVEGANILTRNLMIFGQGAIRCHPYVLDEIEGLNDSNQTEGLKKFDKAFFAHVGYAVQNFVHTFCLGLSQGWYRPTPDYIDKKISYYYRHLTRMSSAISFVSDLTMLFIGGDLKRKERLSARLGDVLSQLYVASAVIRYYEHNGRKEEDHAYVNYALGHCLYEIQNAFVTFFDNFPNRLVARFMAFTVFPLGARFKQPKDKLSAEIAESMMQAEGVRKRLIQTTYLDTESDSSVATLEKGFQAMLQVDEIIVTMKQAMREKKLDKTADLKALAEQAYERKVITETQHESMTKFFELQDEVIRVDEFSKDYFKRIQELCQNETVTEVA